MPITGTPVTLATFRIVNAINVDTTRIQIDSYQIPRDGIYLVVAAVTYRNSRSNAAGVRWVELLLRHGTAFATATQIAANVQQVVHVATGDEYATASLTWVGSLVKDEYLYLGADCAVANRIAVFSADGASQWSIVQIHSRIV